MDKEKVKENLCFYDLRNPDGVKDNNDLLAVAISRFDVKQEDIYKINGVIRKHIEGSGSGFYVNIEDEKNHIRSTLYDIMKIALNGI